ncbi:unnamed protein product, partial [marine sediment metagenome]
MGRIQFGKLIKYLVGNGVLSWSKIAEITGINQKVLREFVKE